MQIAMSPTALTLVLIACCPAFAQQAPSPDFTLRVNSDLVVLEAGVTDPRGANVPDLKLSDFQVYEDGRLQTIRQFSAEERPATIGLVIDNSGSMRPKRAEVITAALGLIAASNPDDEVFVVNFNDSATLGLPPQMPFSGDIAELRRALSIGRAQGKTALNDAMILALDHLAQGKWDKKALLLVSDGGDNSSQHTSKDVIAAIEHAQAIVYTIGLFDPEDPDRTQARCAGSPISAAANPACRSGPRRLAISAGVSPRTSAVVTRSPTSPRQRAVRASCTG